MGGIRAIPYSRAVSSGYQPMAQPEPMWKCSLRYSEKLGFTHAWNNDGALWVSDGYTEAPWLTVQPPDNMENGKVYTIADLLTRRPPTSKQDHPAVMYDGMLIGNQAWNKVQMIVQSDGTISHLWLSVEVPHEWTR